MSTPEIIETLREKLKQNSLDGLIVPHSDAFQNEFLPPDSKRLAYVTGVDTSAGLAIILLESAAFFVDGRYMLIAKKEVNPDVFSVLPWSFETVQTFLEASLTKEMCLGVDPWTLTTKDFEGFQNISKFLGIHLVSLSSNLIDDLWKDRPVPALSPAFLWEDCYAGEASLSKRTRIAAELEKEGVDAFYIGLPESLNWLLNIRGKDVPFTPLLLATGILYSDASIDVFTNLEKIPPSFSNHFGPSIRFLERHQLETSLSKLSTKAQKIWYDPHFTPVAILEILNSKKAILFSGSDPCLLAKSLKNPTEISGVQKAHQRDGLAVVQFLSWIEDQPNTQEISEITAAQKLTSFREKLPLFHSLSFEVISAVGSNGAIVHYHAKEGCDKMLSSGELYLVDSGGQYLDGTTDITRTILLGKTALFPEAKEAFTRVLKGHIALASIKFPKGTTGVQLDVLARQFLWEKGLDYSHGTGHGVGAFLSVHQSPPSISQRPTASFPLEQGMIVSNEPGYYKENAFGIRIESLLLVKNSDVEDFYEFETLTRVPIDKKLILKELLTAFEISWLNLYHKRVFESLDLDLNSAERQWLKEATAPL
ncbi:MAG TPA: aminopeptidase P family protein [Alphaproteobacteria bacterium]|nr:aminopeptidase P family protein [Alphaproteobacteria bacterium]HQS94454.1 aminopeptidase P family protein [Alphaproteobacteria bacterium]